MSQNRTKSLPVAYFDLGPKLEYKAEGTIPLHMISHYLQIAFRQILKNKVYSFISVAGLGLGLASVFMIVQYLRHELSYDKFHEGAKNIYRIAWFTESPQTRTPHPMPLAMVRDFPEVENGTTLTPLYGRGLTRQTFSVRNPEKDVRFDETNVLAVDTTFFKVFSFPLIKGNVNTVLKNPGGVLLSESTAKKYFGDEEAVGKTLLVNDDKRAIEVVGVFKDVPENSHFHFDMLISFLRLKYEDPADKWFTWEDFGHFNYVKLKPGTDPKRLEAKLLDWVPKYSGWTPSDIQGLKTRGYGFRLQPITDIHLRSHLRWELEPNGNSGYVYMMTAAASLILIIACLNFINLMTAQSTERAKEIGIRKTLGAFRSQLARQFVGESLLIACFSIIVAGVLIEGAVPFYNSFAAIPIALTYEDFLFFLTGTGLIVGILAGIYPALYLSTIKPGLILKGKFIQSPGGAAFRKGLMVFQFFAAMVLTSSSLIISDQLHFIKNKSLGFNDQEVIVMPLKERSYQYVLPKFEELQTELQRIPGVKSVSASSNIQGQSFNQNAIIPVSDPEASIDAAEVFVDYDFFKVMDIKLKEGRLFSRENKADKDTYVINETAAKNLFPNGAVGKEVYWDDEDGKIRGTIIGVVKDFHYQSLRDPIRPLIFIPRVWFNFVVIKLDTRDFDNSIASIEKTWKKFDSRFDFEFSFLSDQLTKQYSTEQHMASVMIFFSSLAVIITCMGLLGIAGLTFRQKTKEVTIRKVLGATGGSLAVLLLKNFTSLVAIAVVFAIPFVWWIMNSWLENFSFRIGIDPLVFIAATMLLMVVTWVTLSYLTLKLTRVNPAETLRAE